MGVLQPLEWGGDVGSKVLMGAAAAHASWEGLLWKMSLLFPTLFLALPAYTHQKCHFLSLFGHRLLEEKDTQPGQGTPVVQGFPKRYL